MTLFVSCQPNSIPVVPVQMNILSQEESKALVERIHENINNGVYKAGKSSYVFCIF